MLRCRSVSENLNRKHVQEKTKNTRQIRNRQQQEGLGCVLVQLIVLIYSSVREIPDGEALNIEKKKPYGFSW